MINRDKFGDVQGFVCKIIVWHPRFYQVMGSWFYMYSETPPYGHLGNTVTSFLFTATLFWAPGKTALHFPVKKKTLVNTAKFFWPIGDRISVGFLFNWNSTNVYS